MKKNIKLSYVILVALFIFISAFYYFRQNSRTDECTDKDREIMNCIPAGRCTPPFISDVVVDCSTIDWDIKDYDSKQDPKL